jgi:hypothetical protein
MIPFKRGVDWSTKRCIPAGTYTKSSSIGGRSVPQVLTSDHLITYLKLSFKIEGIPPIFTSNVFFSGRVSLEETLQTIYDWVFEIKMHYWPSILIEGVELFKYKPVKVNV